MSKYPENVTNVMKIVQSIHFMTLHFFLEAKLTCFQIKRYTYELKHRQNCACEFHMKIYT